MGQCILSSLAVKLEFHHISSYCFPSDKATFLTPDIKATVLINSHTKYHMYVVIKMIKTVSMEQNRTIVNVTTNLCAFPARTGQKVCCQKDPLSWMLTFAHFCLFCVMLWFTRCINRQGSLRQSCGNFQETVSNACIYSKKGTKSITRRVKDGAKRSEFSTWVENSEVTKYTGWNKVKCCNPIQKIYRFLGLNRIIKVNHQLNHKLWKSWRHQRC